MFCEYLLMWRSLQSNVKNNSLCNIFLIHILHLLSDSSPLFSHHFQYIQNLDIISMTCYFLYINKRYFLLHTLMDGNGKHNVTSYNTIAWNSLSKTIYYSCVKLFCRIFVYNCSTGTSSALLLYMCIR